MGNLSNKMRRIASDWLDIPQDVVANLPRIQMIGPYRVHIENHHGVERFTEAELRLKTAKGLLEITGKKLVIHTIHSDEVRVDGEVSGVKFLG
ncbi:sporulation protein YqfC [Melghirimyces algeriensis]|uniref:Sporulation protein YqfC n=1 Tax=Melghirimyces algeriensis TaxID=910412 RepID=A0A521BUX1_9BACL|nr:sporulation protein YqfC [Melghirimyces algeriensis]SMO50270.1 sporulation protein YqfC [Melghirimyces algeriensis]